MSENWVQVWGQAHSAFSFFYYPSCKKTYRTVIKSSVSGEQIRIELSNECAKNAVLIGALTVAKCDKNGNLTEEDFQTYRFTPEVLQDFQEYTRMYEQNQGNGAALQSRFGKTYWFYYHFATMKK